MIDAPWPLDQIQGFLLRGYRMSFARHLALTITDAAAARAFIASLTDAAPGGPRITTAMPWGETPPPYCLNIGFTYGGLETLEVKAADLAVLQNEPNYWTFTTGAAAAAAGLYETPSDDWIMNDTQFHVLLSMWANDETVLDELQMQLGPLLEPGFAGLRDDRIFDTQALFEGQVYFGYQDGIAQPIIEGSPFGSQPDGDQDLVDSSAFLIGTGSDIYGATRFSFDLYGCFGAFMVLRQDVEAFQAQVRSLAPQMTALGVTDFAIQQKAVMATFCGRWPNGTPLEQFPISGDNEPLHPPPPQKINDFRYGAGSTADTGTVCPVGAHIRRGNMRVKAGEDGSVFAFQGTPSSSHRIMRRAMPYQIPHRPDDRLSAESEKGLAGLFLGASFLQQYELVLGSWVNYQFCADSTLADPVIGSPPPSAVLLPTPGLDTSIGPVNSCVTIKANAYVFYPGIGGIQSIAQTG